MPVSPVDRPPFSFKAICRFPVIIRPSSFQNAHLRLHSDTPDSDPSIYPKIQFPGKDPNIVSIPVMTRMCASHPLPTPHSALPLHRVKTQGNITADPSRNGKRGAERPQADNVTLPLSMPPPRPILPYWDSAPLFGPNWPALLGLGEGGMNGTWPIRGLRSASNGRERPGLIT